MPGVTPECRLDCIPPHLVTGLWQWLEPQMLRACKSSRGELQAGTIKSRASSGDLSIWVVSHTATPANRRAPLAVAVTRNENWSGEIVCRIVAFAGIGMTRWKHLWAGFERTEREIGVTRIVFEGRKGWQRAMPGFETVRIVMEKRL